MNAVTVRVVIVSDRSFHDLVHQRAAGFLYAVETLHASAARTNVHPGGIVSTVGTSSWSPTRSIRGSGCTRTYISKRFMVVKFGRQVGRAF